MGPSLFFPGLPLNENTRRTIAQKIRALFAGSIEGAWYDPSDLSTMQALYNVEGLVTASGQNVGLILDKRLGLVQTANQIADPDTGSMTPAGTSPPVVTTTTHLGRSCRAIAFDIPAGAGGLGVSSAYIPPQGTVPTGTLRFAFEVSFSRALTGSEQIQIYTQGPSDVYSRVFNSSTTPAAVGAWIPCVVYKPAYGVSAAAQVSVYSAGTWPGSSPVTVYFRAVQVNTILGNHAYQTTSAARPIFRDIAGVRYLEFDGVDDYLRATFATVQPIDRISALKSVTWTANDLIFGNGATGERSILYQSTTTGVLAIYSSSTALSGPTGAGLNVPVVVRECHNGASSSLSYGVSGTTGTVGINANEGITLGASGVGSAPSNFHLYQVIMRGSTTALTDTQITFLRKVCYAAAGLPFPGYEETEVSRMFSSAPTAEGAWYDPSDLTTMFQDRYGTTPVTATGQPVGLMLDKRLGYALGAQFSIPGIWTPGGSGISGSGSTVTLAGASAGAFVGRSLGLTPGLRYRIDYTVSNYSSGGVAVNPGGNFNSPMARANGAYAAHMVCDPDSNFYVVADADGGTLTVTIDAVRQIPGNHATQPTSAARPIFRDVAGLRYLEFDGVDDSMHALFTIAEPIDRVSAIQQVAWANSGRIFDGGTVNAATLFQNSVSPRLDFYSGVAILGTTALAVGVNGVITERYQGASSRLALNNGAYVTGSTGVLLPGGISLGSSSTATNRGNPRIYQVIERGSATAMTDAQVSACRALCAIKSGVTL